VFATLGTTSSKKALWSSRPARRRLRARLVSQWKVKAFLEMGRQLHSELVTNLVSIGDSNFEHDAAHVLGSQFSHSLIKTVKLQERPSPQEQTKELDLLAPKLKTIVEKACNLKVRLERKC